jgi:hypothetical protein
MKKLLVLSLIVLSSQAFGVEIVLKPGESQGVQELCSQSLVDKVSCQKPEKVGLYRAECRNEEGPDPRVCIYVTSPNGVKKKAVRTDSNFSFCQKQADNLERVLNAN